MDWNALLEMPAFWGAAGIALGVFSTLATERLRSKTERARSEVHARQELERLLEVHRHDDAAREAERRQTIATQEFARVSGALIDVTAAGC